MMWGYYNGAGMSAWMIISSVIWLVLIGVAVWALVRWVGSRAPTATPLSPTAQGPLVQGPSAQEILRQRFARGEIDQPTFERMQAVLDGSAPSQTRQAVGTDGSRTH